METNNQVVVFRDMASLYLRYSKGRTKLHHALDKMLKRLKRTHEKFIDDQSDLRTDAASVDPESKVLLKDEKGNYSYTKEKEKELRANLRKLGDALALVEPHYINEDEIPSNLEIKYEGNDGKIYTLTDYDVRSAFEGFVIKLEE